MTELHEFPPTRSQRAKWVLEELGIDYKSHIVNLSAGEQNSEAYRALHPLGVVPALTTDSYSMFESVAIVLQLIDEHPEKNLAPAVGSPARARYYQWCVFAGTEMDPALMTYFDNALRPLEAMRPPGRQHDADFAAIGRGEFEVRAAALSKELEGRDHMLESGFSGADILIGHSCFMASYMKLIAGHPVLEAYYGRLQQRPAFQRAYNI